MIKKSLIVILTVFVLNIVIASCCTETYIINELEFIGVKLYSDGGDDRSKYFSEADTFTDQIVFEIKPKFDYISALTIFQNSANALSCGRDYQNSLLESSFSVSSNRGIVVDGDSIKMRENWLDNENVKKYLQVFTISHDNTYLEFNDDFKTNSIIENGSYRFYFECETSDNKIFKDSVDVVLNLNQI